MQSTETRSLGAVHGRFQPFHRGHLGYVLMALDRATQIYIGVTNPDAPGLSAFEATDATRHLPANNPFSFDERQAMVLGALETHEVGLTQRVTIVPFDVSAEPKTWPSVIPLEATQYVAPHEPWDTEKARRFTQAGYRVELLPIEQGRITATQIRVLMQSGDPAWRDLVAPGVAKMLDNHTFSRSK